MASNEPNAAGTLQLFIPFWGDPELLYATVESVRAQTVGDWTAVIVDDCYPDDSVARHFAAEADPRIAYRRNPQNLGIAKNFAHCLELAEGPLMSFLGCDDLVHPHYVATILEAHRRFPHAALIQPGVRVIDETDREVHPLADRVKEAISPRPRQPVELFGEDLAVSLLRGDWLYWPSLVFRTERIKRYQFRLDLPIILDLALIIDMVAAGESLAVTPEVCFSYRRHAKSLSATSRLGGTRFSDEAGYYRDTARQMEALGWHRAARTARLRWSSRLHALSLLPAAIASRQSAAIGTLLEHACR